MQSTIRRRIKHEEEVKQNLFFYADTFDDGQRHVEGVVFDADDVELAQEVVHVGVHLKARGESGAKPTKPDRRSRRG